MNLTYTSRFYELYPTQPIPDEQCTINQSYQSLPEDWPRRHELAGPASVSRRLYPPTPNCYPSLYRDVPSGTLYDNDLGAVTLIRGKDPDGNDLGTYPKRSSYQYKPYPLTNMYAREMRRYRPEILPFPAIRSWTSYPVTTAASALGDWGV